MASVSRSIDVDARPEEAYEMWSLVEEYPAIFEGLAGVRYLDDRHYAFRDSGGRERVAHVTLDEVGWRVTWRFEGGLAGGSARVAKVNRKTRVVLELSGDESVLALSRLAGRGLLRFKRLVEERHLMAA